VNALSFIIATGCLVFGLAANAGNITGNISFQDDTVHLEFSGAQNWDYDVKRGEAKGQPTIDITVEGLNDATVKQLESFKSDYVKSISVNTKGPDGKSIVTFVLAGSDIDSFDYLTDQPSRLILDFYVNPAAKTAQAAKAKKETPVADEAAKSAKIAKKEKTPKGRKPATADVLTVNPQGAVDVALNDGPQVRSGIFDGGDPSYERFTIKDYEVKEEAIIKAKNNYYITFPMLETAVPHWEQLKAAPTIYEISPKGTEENKQARLLLTLFEKERYAVYLKTEQWFKDKYPQSEYNELIDYMTADVFYNLYQEKKNPADFDKAIQKYREAVAKYPKSPLAEKTSLKVGYLTLDRGDYLNALRLFNEHLNNKNFPTKDGLSQSLAKLGMGLAYSKLNKWNDAIAQFEDVEKTAQNRDLKVESSYRRGDVWTRAKDYAKAVDEYRNSLKKYPEGQTQFPNAYYNQAEALFGMDKFTTSLDTFRDFVKKFPNNDYAPLAMTRMGELLDVLGADKSRVMGAYLETYFRYGENPKAIIARLHLLSGRMKGMKPKEVTNAVQEIMDLAKRAEDLPGIEQFANVMIADGYTRRGDYQKAIDLLSKYYKENPTTVNAPVVTTRIVANINDKLDSEVEAGDFISALKTHQKYSDSWLKGSPRLDTKYNVGRSFELAGVPKEADKYYRDVLNRLYAIRGTQAEKEIKVTEEVPTEDEMNLRLAAVNAQEQKFNQSYENIKNIKSPEKLSEVDQIERVSIAVKLLEKRGDLDSAIRYLGELLRTWKGRPELVAEPYLKLSELQLKQGKSDEALQSLTAVDELMRDSKIVPVQIHAKVLEMIGNINMEKGQTEKGLQAYNRLLEKYEETMPLASIRYKIGEIHFKAGEVQKAAEVWNSFKGEKSGFWKNLAQEQLKNSEWRSDYKKYIKRIPAMSGSTESN